MDQARLSVNLDVDLHRRFKTACAAHSTTMIKELRTFIAKRTAELEGGNNTAKPAGKKRAKKKVTKPREHERPGGELGIIADAILGDPMSEENRKTINGPAKRNGVAKPPRSGRRAAPPPSAKRTRIQRPKM